MGGRKRAGWFRPDVDHVELRASARRLAKERRDAYGDGNLTALYDELFEAGRNTPDDETQADAARVPLPLWVVRGARKELLKVMNARAHGRKGPGAAWQDRYFRDCIEYEWFKTAQEFRRGGVKGVAVLDAVQEVWRDAGPFTDTRHAMRHAIVERVPKALRATPGRYYQSQYLRDKRVPLARPVADVKAEAQELNARINNTLQTARTQITARRAKGARQGAVLRQLGKD